MPVLLAHSTASSRSPWDKFCSTSSVGVTGAGQMKNFLRYLGACLAMDAFALTKLAPFPRPSCRAIPIAYTGLALRLSLSHPVKIGIWVKVPDSIANRPKNRTPGGFAWARLRAQQVKESEIPRTRNVKRSLK